MNTLGIDIGATKIFFLITDSKGEIIYQKRIESPKAKNSFIKKISQEILAIQQNHKIDRIGIAIAGLLDRDKGKIIFSPNMKYLNGLNLVKEIGNRTGLRRNKIKIENDGNCFALAESFIGIGKKSKSVLAITLGSGIGGGLVLNKRLYLGSNNNAMEIGHMTIKFDGKKCSCGNTGCFEEYASAKFFKEAGLDSKKEAQKASFGDKKSISLFAEFGKNLSVGISNLIKIIDPEIVILGGGLANNYQLFSKELVGIIKKTTLPPQSKAVKIVKSKLGDKAVALGATLLFNN